MILLNYVGKILLWRSLYFSMALLGFVTWFYTTAEVRYSDKRFVRKLKDNAFEYKAEVAYQDTPERSIRYVEIGQDVLPLIVFIHGAPSSSAFWRGMMKDSLLLSQAKLLAVDRPGYGYSGYGRPMESVKMQARLIAEVIKAKRQQHQQIILHGSSYGGTVAARIAMDYPDLVDGLLLQSSSLKAHAEKTYSISYPTHHWSLRWAIPGSLRTANAEKLSHHLSLADMEAHWSNIKAATIIMHGSDDGLVYPENAHFAFERLVNASFKDLQFFEGRGHDLLWTQTGDLKASLLQLIRLLTNKVEGASISKYTVK